MSTEKHYVLRSRRTGKIASRTGQLKLINRLQARQLTRSGRGGGIVELLLPKTAKETKALNDDDLTYEVAKVRKRTSGERTKVRSVAESDEFILSLLKIYVQSAGHDERKLNTVKVFVRWICDELQNHDSLVCRLVCKHSPALADRQKPDWWERRIAVRRKRTKAKEFAKTKTES